MRTAPTPDRIFKHTTDEDRRECLFYTQGFCIHGPNCRFRHIKLPAEALPDVANFSTPFESKEEDGEDPVPKNAMFKNVHVQAYAGKRCLPIYANLPLCPLSGRIADSRAKFSRWIRHAGRTKQCRQYVKQQRELLTATYDATVEVIASSSKLRVTDSEYGQKVFEIVRSLPDRRGPCKYFVGRVPDPTYQYLVV